MPRGMLSFCFAGPPACCCVPADTASVGAGPPARASAWDVLVKSGMAERGQIGRNDGRYFRIAPGRLAVGQQDDRLTVARHLDRARRDAVGRDVVAARVVDTPALEPHSHAIGT